MSTEQGGRLFIWLKVIWVLAYSQFQPLSKTPGWWVDPLASPWWPCYPSTACTCSSNVQKFASYERVISTWSWITHKLSKRLAWLGLRKRPNTPNSQGIAGRFIQITIRKVLKFQGINFHLSILYRKIIKISLFIKEVAFCSVFILFAGNYLLQVRLSPHRKREISNVINAAIFCPAGQVLSPWKRVDHSTLDGGLGRRRSGNGLYKKPSTPAHALLCGQHHQGN